MLVPAGLPHSVPAEAFVLELQEPTDLSILLEWEDFAVDGDRDGHLDLGFDVALGAVDLGRRSPADLHALVGPREDVVDGGVHALLPRVADPYFRADLVVSAVAPVRLDAGFAIVVVLDGAGVLATRAGSVEVSRGDVAVVPFAAGEVGLHGRGADATLRAVVCRPPAPDAPEGR
jgi:mannose-6-phosphate isomerase